MKNLELKNVRVQGLDTTELKSVDGGENGDEIVEMHSLFNEIIDGDLDKAWDRIKSWF
ncbi:MAG: hypothetical protein ABFS12_14545 [Bacteroidota bacterium]